MEVLLGGIIDKIGIENAVEQVEDFFLFLEEGRKEKLLKRYEDTLAEQKALRYRWKERNT